MGLGDQLMATGMARGAFARGKRVAFGDGQKIHWDQHSADIFRSNPNIAKPGSERDRDLEWIPYYKGNRIYNRHDRVNDRWIWNYDFRPKPGEVYFDGAEKRQSTKFGQGFIIIEPHVADFKSSAPNKDWGFENYQEVASKLLRDGYRVGQFSYKGKRQLSGVEALPTSSFRHALAILSHASLYIGPEGGLHHGAAAVDVPAVVIFGGFIPPQVTGYDGHKNLTGGAEACGSLHACAHCRQAMQKITVEEVLEEARDVSEWTK